MEREHTVETVVLGTVAVFRVTGNITSSEDSPLPEKLVEVTGKGAKAVVLRFTPSTYINSAGIAMLIGLTVDAQKKANPIRIVFNSTFISTQLFLKNFFRCAV